MAAKINKFSQFSFSYFFPFVIAMIMFLKYLRHKVNMVKGLPLIFKVINL